MTDDDARMTPLRTASYPFGAAEQPSDHRSRVASMMGVMIIEEAGSALLTGISDRDWRAVGTSRPQRQWAA